MSESSVTGYLDGKKCVLVIVNNRVDPVRYRQYGAFSELFPDCFLDDFVRFDIDRRGCFVENEYPTFPQQRSGQADELTLPNREIASTLGNNHIETCMRISNEWLFHEPAYFSAETELSQGQGRPYSTHRDPGFQPMATSGHP